MGMGIPMGMGFHENGSSFWATNKNGNEMLDWNGMGMGMIPREWE